MANEQLATLRAADGSELLEVLVRPRTSSDNTALRNVEGVQPPGLNRQGAFGSGIYQAGAWERMMAVCDVSSYASVQHAMSALDNAIRACRAVRFEGWELPITAGVGIVERAYLARGFRARVRLIPASPHWRFLAGAGGGAGSQSDLTVTGSGFTAEDVGRLVVFANGAEALITSFFSSSSVGTDTEQTVPPQAYSLFTVATGLL